MYVLYWNRHIFQMCSLLFCISHRSEWVWNASCWFFSGMMQGSVNMSLKISNHSHSKQKPLLFWISAPSFIADLDYKVIQFMYTNFTTIAGHGLAVCRKHWLTQELSFTVDLFTWILSKPSRCVTISIFYMSCLTQQFTLK